jgi:spermidine/putrescine transport system permease protein
VLPLVMPGILASFLICFTISIDEFIIANFLGSGRPILSVYIFGQFRFPAKVPSMLALGTILVCFSILLLAIAEYFRRRGIAKAGGKDTGGFL